jgi:DNA repair protein RecN (Recombination protein N)
LQRLDFVKFQLAELDSFNVQPNELETLEAERKRLGAADRLKQLYAQVEAVLHGDEQSAFDQLDKAQQLLNEALKFDVNLKAAVEQLVTVNALSQEVARGLSRQSRLVEHNPTRLAEVDERVDALKRLMRKYAATPAALIEKRDALAKELLDLEGREERREVAVREHAQAMSVLSVQASVLTALRRKGAGLLEKRVQSQLNRLSMAQARFSVNVLQHALSSEGTDTVEFLFSANPGETQKPLSKVASGGELSRILLSVRASASEEGSSCTLLVFDEADAGVGGAVADEMGRLIHEVSGRHQVLCVTHLAQVAAHADAHVVVRKHVYGARTRAEVFLLDSEELRAQELARMLSGTDVTKEAIEAAKALRRQKSRGVAAVRDRETQKSKLAPNEKVKKRKCSVKLNALLPYPSAKPIF